MTKTKLDTLLIIRGLLALSVVVWHIGTVNANTPAWMNIPGRTAVWIFFGISGYVISYGFITQRYVLNKEGIRAFYLNRFLRIYPLFLLVSVVTMLTSYFMNGEILLNFADIPSQLLMLQFNHEYILSGVFWTLGVEVQFYVVAPLLIIFLLDTFHNEWLLDISLYFLFVMWVPFFFYFFEGSFDGRNLFSNLSHFFVGMMGCKLVLAKKQPTFSNYFLLGLILSIVFVTNYLYQHSIKFYWSLGALLIDLAILAAILLHTNLGNKAVPQKNLLLRFFIFLGIISYGVYAWHPYLAKYVPWLENNTLLVVITTVCIAFVSYKFIEQPILKMKKQRKESVAVS